MQSQANSEELENLYGAIELEFDSMVWKPTRWRKNVTDAESCLSMNLGLVLRPRCGYSLGANNSKYPRLYVLLKQLSAALRFPCTTFTINKNLQCKPHVDRQNNGDSLIVSLGRFQGGLLLVDEQPHNIWHSPLIFNGAKHIHATTPFEGMRYSIVMYSIGQHSAAAKRLLAREGKTGR